MTIEIPRFKGLIISEFISTAKQELIEAYIFSLTTIEARPLLFTIHTIDGALYSRIPIQAILHRLPTGTQFNADYLDPWGAISSSSQAVSYNYLKDYHVISETLGRGTYKFTIDYFNGGFSEDPEQHKTSNIIFLDNGQIAALPNNFTLFKDRHFTTPNQLYKYKRNKTYWD